MYKKIYFLCAGILHLTVTNSQIKLGTSFSCSIPLGEMAHNINPLYSINGAFLYAFTSTKQRLAAGAEFGIGNYAFVTKEQEIGYADGSGVTTNVDYESDVFNAALLGRYTLVKDGNVIPYVNAKAGWSSFFSNVTVEDPESPSSCRALERKNITADNTFFFAYGGGLLFDLKMFSKKAKARKYQVELVVNHIVGGNIDYINTKNIQAKDNTNTTNSETSPKTKPLNIRFINVNTQIIHEHQVAELYTSPLRMLDCKLGMVFNF